MSMMPFPAALWHHPSAVSVPAGPYSMSALGGLYDSTNGDTMSANDVRLINFTTPAGNASIVERVFFANSAANNGLRIRAVITDASGNLVAQSANVTLGTDRLVELPLITPANLSANTSYRVGINTESGITIRRATTGTSYTATAAFGSAMPSTLTLTAAGLAIHLWVPCLQATTPSATVGYVSESPDGHGALTTNSPEVQLPDNYAVGDIVFIQIFASYLSGGVDDVFTAPTGWTEIGNTTLGSNTNTRAVLYWRRIDGTESPLIYCARAGAGGPNFTTIKSTIFRGMKTSGTPYEGLANNGATSTTPNGSAVTTTGANRTLVDFFYVADDNTITVDGSWTKQWEELDLTASDSCVAGSTRTAATATSYSASSNTMVDSDLWRTFTLALIQA